MRDVLRADRRFLADLQVTREGRVPADAGGAGGGGLAAGGGAAADGGGETEELDRRLEVLLQQQKQMEKWRPKGAR
jgi:hypothetical protein